MFHIRDEGPVRWLTIDNPERRNAVAFGAWSDLAGHFDDFGVSDQRVLVLAGAGADFCSGADLGGAALSGGMSATAWHESMRSVGDAARALHALPKPTIAAVDGVAVGAGMNMALACDVLIASDRARFAEIFVRRGLTVDFGGSWLLPRRVGLARAKELALTGRIFGAEEALAYGVATEVVGADELHDRAGEMAATLAAGAPLAQRFIKAAFDRSYGMSFDEMLAFENQAQVVCLMSEDVLEGVAAFLQKRDPEFRGR